MLSLGVVTVVLTVVVLVYTVLVWKNSYLGIAGRAYDTLVTVAAIAFVWFMNYWNLLVVQRDVAAGPGISAHAHQEGAKGNHRH